MSNTNSTVSYILEELSTNSHAVSVSGTVSEINTLRTALYRELKKRKVKGEFVESLDIEILDRDNVSLRYRDFLEESKKEKGAIFTLKVHSAASTRERARARLTRYNPDGSSQPLSVSDTLAIESGLSDTLAVLGQTLEDKKTT